MKLSLSLLLALSAFALPAEAQIVRDMTIVKVGNTGSGDFAYYGATPGGMRAYSIATTSCNEGNVELPWISQQVHIGTNLFRIGDGRVEQLGYSWVKLGFCAVSEPGCGSCQGTPCDTLGIGCADTYSSFLNDGKTGHDKADIDATRAVFSSPASAPSGGTHRGRLKVDSTKMGQPGFRYIAEAQYLYEGDHLYGNHRNNVSWREVNTSASSGGINGTGHDIRRYECAVEAWAEIQGNVTIAELVNEDEPTRTGDAYGFYVLGGAVTDLGNGQYRYEYALQNLTSDQAGASFSLPFDCGNVNISDVFFQGVQHHSGTPWASDAWNFSSDNGQLRWEVPQTFSENADASAIRWGELFNFGFTADSAPVTTTATVGMFKPGSNMALSGTVKGPCAPCGGTISNYCTTSPNSVGAGATLSFTGSNSISANDLTLIATGAPANQFGLFYYGAGQTSAPFGEGIRCVSAGGAGTFRLNPATTVDFFGQLFRQVDFNAPPANGGPGAILSGSTWNFQLWYRDPAGGGSGFNLSDGITATFCP